MKIDKVAQGIANYINRSKGAQKVLRNISDNPGLYTTVAAVVVGTTARPALTLAITPNKKDGVYSAASSIASSMMELIGGFLMLKPLQKAIDKSSKELYNSKDSFFFQNKEYLRGYKQAASRIYKTFTFPITSAVRFAMVPVIAVGLAKVGIAKGTGLEEKHRVDAKA